MLFRSDLVGQRAQGKARLMFDPRGQDQGPGGEHVGGSGSVCRNGREGIGGIFSCAAKNEEFGVESAQGRRQLVNSLATERGGRKKEPVA